MTRRPLLTATVVLRCRACYSSVLAEVPIEVRVCPAHGDVEVGVAVEEVQAWSQAHLMPTISLA